MSGPLETNSPLIINPYGKLALATAFQGLQTVGVQSGKIG